MSFLAGFPLNAAFIVTMSTPEDSMFSMKKSKNSYLSILIVTGVFSGIKFVRLGFKSLVAIMTDTLA